MKIVIAIDSFKGSLSSMEAGYAAEAGIRKVYPNAEITVHPIADGGEGTAHTLVTGLNGSVQQLQVTGPLGTPVNCTYGILENHTAVIEMASAAGLTLVPKEQRNPLHTTTYGVGEMIKDAINKGYRHFIIGIGGSATNDGGLGMLQALGYSFLDEEGREVPFGAVGLSKLHSISSELVIPELKNCTFKIACDVNNILCGKDGCSAVFGPQKGAQPADIINMDNWLRHYAALAKEQFPEANLKAKGAGAAGGLGFAFLTFTNASLESGIKLILEETHLEDYIKKADFVITGEGQLDEQTALGKVPIGIASLAKKHKKPVIAFSGAVTEGAAACNKQGITAFFPILRKIVNLDEAMQIENAKNNLTDTVEQVFRLLKLSHF